MAEPITWTQETRRLGDLAPWPRNPRQIKSAEARRLAESFTEFGQVETLAIGPGQEVYNGHQRLNVLMARYGPDYEVDVRVSSRPLTEKEREKLTVYLHKGAAGEWDFDILANEFEVSELIEWGFDAAELGIDLGGGTDDDAEPQIDRAEELREQWGVEPGQLWRLPSRTPGQEHRLICGDCTDAAVVERVMGGEKAHMIFTDPPYGVDVAGGSHDPRDKNNYRSGNTIEGDALDDDALSQLWCNSFRESQRACLPGAAVYACFSDSRAFPSLRGLVAAGIYQSQFVIWAKQQMVFSRKDYHPQHEPIIYGWIPGAAHNAVLERDKTTLWQIDRPMRSDKEHPTQKPIDLPQQAIGNHDAPLVYDPFSGSGTTIIAAENLSRQCRAVEIAPAYVAVALQRYVDAFGIEPELVN